MSINSDIGSKFYSERSYLCAKYCIIGIMFLDFVLVKAYIFTSSEIGPEFTLTNLNLAFT